MIVLPTTETRRCKHHGELPIDKWYKNIKRDVYLCRICINNQKKNRRLNASPEQREKKRIYEKIYRDKNLERIRENNKKYTERYIAKCKKNDCCAYLKRMSEHAEKWRKTHDRKFVLNSRSKSSNKAIEELRNWYVRNVYSKMTGKKYNEITTVEIETYRILMLINRKTGEKNGN